MVTKRTKPERTEIARPSKARRASRAPKIPVPPKRRAGEDFFAYVVRLGAWIPEDERAKLPTDLAANFHHYAHGSPKQDP